MQIRQRRCVLVASALALLVVQGPKLWSAELSAAGADRRPNILLAIADDWSWPQAGVYGDRVIQTPTFDRVAKQGVLFQQAYVAAPSCTSSRAAVLTGQWHWRLEESANLWSTLQAKFPVYPDLLEQAGYYVGYTGKGWGPGRIAPGGRTRNPAGPRYANFQQFLAQRPAGKPFCFWFGSLDPHRPYKAGNGAASGMPVDQIKPPGCLPNDPEVRNDVADYYWEVQRFDHNVGQILKRIERSEERRVGKECRSRWSPYH